MPAGEAMRSKYAILIVDDELPNLQKLRRTFLNDYQVFQAQNGEEALEILRVQAVAAVITDQRMPGMSGVELLRRSLGVRPDTVRIILTGYTEVEDLMDAINRGQVHRYVTKPWEPAFLKQALEQELERWELKRENERLAQELKKANEQLEKENYKLRQEIQLLGGEDRRLIYRSREMEELIRLLDRVIPTDSTVLIQGETGTGKELLARYIHETSHRREQAFVPVNCGAVPADLVESAFFGHRKGAFTGATENRRGFFELANQGTLFLDEIGEAPLELQVKLLRVLQDGQIMPVGSESGRQISVRVIASTNRSLLKAVEEGRFRQDLFFRLNVFSVFVPPLRTRKEDIEVLCSFFLDRICRRLNKEIAGFEESTLQSLKCYGWPGNIRELENEVERLAILCEPNRTIGPSMLSERIQFPTGQAQTPRDLKDKLADFERRLIMEALRNHDNNKSHAAEALGISRQTIIAKLKQYNLAPEA
jgi:DNA-binding NtrC family response regulator